MAASVVQSSAAANIPASGTVDTEKLVVDLRQIASEEGQKYREFLSSESDRHQQMLEQCFDALKWLVGIAAAVLTTLGGAAIVFVTFLNVKSTAELKARFDSIIESKATSIIGNRLQQFDVDLKARIEHTEKQAVFFEKRCLSLTEQLEKEFTGLEKRQNKTDEELESIIEYASAIGHAAVVLTTSINEQDPIAVNRRQTTMRSVLFRLQRIYTKLPTHRTLAIFTARLFRATGDLPSAIKTLRHAVQKREESSGNLEGDRARDHAALLFNLACYLNIEAQSAVDPELKVLYQNEAVEALKKCFRLHPKDREEAKEDPDLSGLFPTREDWDSI